MRRHVRLLIAAGVALLIASVFLTAGRQARYSGKSAYTFSTTYTDADTGGVPMARERMSPAPGGGPGGMPGLPPPTPAEAPARPASGAAEAAPLPAVARKVVMTATLTLEVKEFSKVSDQVIAAARQLGGYVGNSQLSLPTDGVQEGTVTIRVPQERYQEALDRLKSLGKVVGETQTAEDVTERFVDLDARVRNLRAEEERILDILSRARTMKDTLLVEERLSAIRERLETIEGQLRYLKYQIAMATITVTLVEKATVLHLAEPQWVWWNEVKGAWHALVVLLQSLVTVVTYVGIFGVIWVPVLGVILWATRRRTKKNDVPPDSA